MSSFLTASWPVSPQRITFIRACCEQVFPKLIEFQLQCSERRAGAVWGGRGKNKKQGEQSHVCNSDGTMPDSSFGISRVLNPNSCYVVIMWSFKQVRDTLKDHLSAQQTENNHMGASLSVVLWPSVGQARADPHCVCCAWFKRYSLSLMTSWSLKSSMLEHLQKRLPPTHLLVRYKMFLLHHPKPNLTSSDTEETCDTLHQSHLFISAT